MNDPLFEYLNERNPPGRNMYYSGEGVKEYKRFPTMLLPTPREISCPISEAIQNRRSERAFNFLPLSAEDISTLLFWSAGTLKQKDTAFLRRPFPSGGGKQPTEIYPIILKCDGIKKGVYHYNAKIHALEHFLSADASVLLNGFVYEFVRDAAMVVLISLARGRQVKKYGSFSYKLGLIEAGHVGQNIYLLSAADNLGCCALGVGDSSLFDGALGLDGINETICYAVAIGSSFKVI